MFSFKKVLILALGFFILVESAAILAKAGAGFQESLDVLQGAKSGDIKKVKAGLKKGVNVNVRFQGYPKIENNHTPLMLAAKYGHLDIVILLVEKGAIIDYKNPDDDKAALDYAKEKKYKKIVSYLEEQKDKSNSTTTTSSTKKKDYLTVLKVTPNVDSKLKPGDVVEFVFKYNIPRSDSPGPCTLTTAFDHKMGKRKFDTNTISQEKGELKLSYIISEYDLATLAYEQKFEAEFVLICPNAAYGGKLNTYFQTLHLQFTNGQTKKTKVQVEYDKGNSISPNRLEILYEDRVVKSGGVNFVLEKGTTLIYQQTKYIINSGKLKESVTADVYGKKIDLQAKTYIYFDKKGLVKGGTVSKATPFKSGTHEFVLQKGSSFESLDNGVLSVGTIDAGAKISLAGKKYNIVARSRLGFFADGIVRILVTKGPLTLTVGKRDIPLPANTQVLVYEKIDKIKEIYNVRETFTFTVKNKKVIFDRMLGIVFYKSGALQSGLLESADKFDMHGQIVPCYRSVMSFNEDESFQSCKISEAITVKHLNDNITLKKLSRPSFYPNGILQYGVIVKPFVAKFQGGSLHISAGKNVSFYRTGILQGAFLEQDESFTIAGKKFLFAKGSHMKFNDDGSAQYGYTLKALRLKDKNKKYSVPAKSMIKFNKKGKITHIRTSKGLVELTGPVIILEN
ncbi:MAG: ankyrin repeat domain-containing protein [Leptospirales bacterium]